MKKVHFDFLLTYFNSIQSEITRYRDREWITQGIFVSALGTIIGFIITNEQKAQNLKYAFDTILILLALGNTYYSFQIHTKLTEQRNIRNRLHYLFELHKIKANNKNLVYFPIRAPQDNNFLLDWFRGFWDHILPFIIFGVLLCGFGIWLLHR